MSSSESKRANGLDTLRALAIILVFMYHYMVFVSHEPTFGWLSTVGWVGVDLFFVLSGYLIGNQLFAGVVKGQQLSLKAFYARRALRTWPAFWVVLAAYFLMPTIMGGNPPPPLWTFLTFTQNIGLVPGTAFSHAWSLCIEEQFYLVLPLAFLLALRVGTHRAQAWWLLGILTLIGIVVRIVLWQTYGPLALGNYGGYHTNVYYATLCRFDEFLPGIAVAFLKNLYPQLWSRITRHGQWLLLAGVVATSIMLYVVFKTWYIKDYGAGFFMTAFGYTLLAMAFAILVVAALSADSWLYRLRIPGVYHIALWSYSTYLTHKPVAYIVQGCAKQWALSSSVTLLVVTLACIAAGAVLYYCIEVPFMAMRTWLAPKLFHDQARQPLDASYAVKPVQ